MHGLPRSCKTVCALWRFSTWWTGNHPWCEGRYNVAFDDVKTIAHAALRHRLLLNFEGLAEEIDPDVIITEILESTPLET